MKPANSAWYAIDLSAAGSGWLRLLHLLLAGLAAALVIVLIATIGYTDNDSPQGLRFDKAQLCVEPSMPSPLRRHALAALLDQPPRTGSSCWRQVNLPVVHRSDATNLSPGEQELARARLRVRYPVPPGFGTQQQLVVFVPRVMGWAWLLSVDGHPVANNLSDWRMTWNRPVIVPLAPGQYHAGQVLDIELAVAYLPSTGFSMARMTVGPAEALEGRVALRRFLQVSMPEACSSALALMGTFFFVFWLSRRDEKAHLLLALACLAWCVCNLQYVLPRVDNPVVEIWYGTIVNLSVTWVMWLIYLIMLRFDPRRTPWMDWALPLYVLLITLLALPVWRLSCDWALVFQAFNTVVATIITALIVRAAVNGGSEIRVIAVALVLALLAGAHDVALLGLVAPPESIYLLPFASLLVLGSFLYAVQRRYLGAIAEHESLSQSLARRLAEREAELNANHARLRGFEREQALTQERQRLMHDMHDGLGSALLTTLAAVEKEQLPQHDVAEALRACVEDLRMVIDSLEPMEHSLVTLLATLRYRIGPRIKATGMHLHWDVQDLPELPWLEAPDALHVLRLVQEALANVIKHAGASSVRIATRDCGHRVEVIVEDDGKGFDPVARGTGGRGLRNMARRAKRLGGELQIESSPHGGARLRLILPVQRG